jgi:hypothetical protein
MPRNVTAAFITALSEGNLYPCLYLEIYFASGPVRLCSAYQDQILASVLYKGVGNFLDVSTIEDGATVQARGINVSLSGIDPTLLPAALSEFQVGLSATLTLGLLADRLPINAPVVAWQGRTDQPTITVDEKTATISIALESVLVDMNTPVPYRYTNQDQQLFYPGDLGFAWVNAIQSISIYWNQTANADGNP